MNCPKCNGKGSVTDKRRKTGIKTCLKCNGVGKVTDPDGTRYYRTSLHSWSEWDYGDEICSSND